MKPMPHAQRVQLAESLRRNKAVVAEAVTTEFFQRHPDWLARYGERGRQRGLEDAAYHVDFLAGAIETGAVAAFENYARWTTNVLRSRGIAPAFVAENLRQVARASSPSLSEPERELITAYTEAACTATAEIPSVPTTAATPSRLAVAQNVFVQAVLKGQRQAALNVALEALREGHSAADIYVEILQESLYEVGRRWEANQITVAEEHMATAITQYVVAQMYSRLAPSGVARGKMIITGVEGELHQVGANMVADLLEADGWDVRFLGTNMPHAGILSAIAEHQPAVLGISATMLFNVPKVRHLIDEVRQKFGACAPQIVLGGSAFRAAPTLGAELGAAGAATDLRAARILVNQLPTGTSPQ
jgi:MerR family transcriptional regulator, light-induced transcriptional regulator